MPQVNYLAILLVAVEAMVIGMLWYGPVFGKIWMKYMGINPHDKKKMEEMKKSSGPAMAASIVGSLVTGYVLAALINSLAVTTLAHGLLTGFLVWLGFCAPVIGTQVLYGGKPKALWIIDSGYYLVYWLLAAVTLTLWV
jgi:hypothetical protein